MTNILKRRFRPRFFSTKDKISAVIRMPDKEEMIITASLINMDKSGIFVTIEREPKSAGIRDHNYLVLSEIRSPGALKGTYWTMRSATKNAEVPQMQEG